MDEQIRARAACTIKNTLQTQGLETWWHK